MSRDVEGRRAKGACQQCGATKYSMIGKKGRPIKTCQKCQLRKQTK